jgi:hypothetical protein
MSRRHDFSPHLVNLAFVREMEHAHLRRKSIPHSDYLFRTATHWRMRAEKMRALAEETHDSTVRAMMLRFAANYDRVAGQGVDPAQHDSIMFRRTEVKPESLSETPSESD